jgi:dolichol-phosphate mannosyltransferase
MDEAMPAPQSATAPAVERKAITVVVPVYYNGASLPQLLEEIIPFEAALKDRNLDLDLIFVNDGSGDDSLVRLLEIKRRRPATKVIALARNFGAVAASKTGFRYATGDAFTILAADLQDPVEQLLLMVEEWQRGATFVVSARASRGDPAMTRLFAGFYYWILDWLVVKGYPQGGYDLMLMDRAMLPYMQDSTKHTNPNLYAYWLGFAPVILYYHRRPRPHGKSRWTFRKRVRFLLDTVTGFSVAPLRLLSGFGVTVATFSFLYGIYIAINALLGKMDTPGFATLAVLIAFFSGLILIMLGVIGEYLWRIFEAVNHKPESVVAREYL